MEVYYRLGCAFLSGVILSQAGSLSQLLTRNILASPSTLGVDALAVFWLILSYSGLIFFNHEMSHQFIFLAGLPFFLLVALLFKKITVRNPKMDTFVFLGLTFNLFVGAIFSLIQFLFVAFNFPFPSDLWFGHFRYASLESLCYLIFFESLLLGFYKISQRNFFLFSMGSTFYRQWLKETDKFMLNLLLLVIVGTFLVTSFFGAFSFVGLIFPIISRRLFFKRFDLVGEIVIGSLFNGLCFMALDFICFYFPIMGAEIPVGLLFTSVGALVLTGLIWRTYQRERLAN
jgi:ABC-type Fe3+-siderophore transport system permease subunit